MRSRFAIVLSIFWQYDHLWSLVQSHRLLLSNKWTFNEEVNSNYKSFNLEEHLIHILLIFKQIFYFRALAGLSWWCFLDVSGAVLRHDQSSRAACTHTFFLRGVLEGKSEKITITYDYIRLLGQRMNNRTFPIIGHRKAWYPAKRGEHLFPFYIKFSIFLWMVRVDSRPKRFWLHCIWSKPDIFMTSWSELLWFVSKIKCRATVTDRFHEEFDCRLSCSVYLVRLAYANEAKK